MPSNSTLVDICAKECEMFEAAGYYAMIYASKSWFNGKLKSSKLDKGNLKSLVEKIENYIEFLKSNTEFDTKFYDIGDGLSVSTWKHE